VATDDRELLLRQLSIALEYVLKESHVVALDWTDIHVDIGDHTAMTINTDQQAVRLALKQEVFDMLLKSLADFYGKPDQEHVNSVRFLMALAFKDLSAAPPPGVNLQTVLLKMLEQVM